MKSTLLRWVGGLMCAHAAWAATPEPQPLLRREWIVDGVARDALVYVPPDGKPVAALLVFHGHGGTMRATADNWSYHTRWPEAVVIYPQGLTTPGLQSDPKGERSGWQSAAGQKGDRDLKWVDAILASVRADYHVDARHTYATGHSNGGVFTYLLWAQRGAQFGAFAPGASVDSLDVGHTLPTLTPKPVFVIAGEKDPQVKFAWQERMIAGLRKLNQCGPGQSEDRGRVRYPSPLEAPVVTYIHPNGHGLPPSALPLVVAFFQECAASAANRGK